MFEIAARSVGVSLAARLVAACFALPGALWIVFGRSRQRAVLLAVFNVGLGLPPVAVGLAVAFTFWRSGPLGWLDLFVYTSGDGCRANARYHAAYGHSRGRCAARRRSIVERSTRRPNRAIAKPSPP